jgi:hypothetical protein
MTQKRIDKGTQEIKAMMAEDADFYALPIWHDYPKMTESLIRRSSRTRE